MIKYERVDRLLSSSDRHAQENKTAKIGILLLY